MASALDAVLVQAMAKDKTKPTPQVST